MLLALAVVSVATACTAATDIPDNDGNKEPVTETPTLNALWVKAGGSTFYAAISQEEGTARIDKVKYTNLIDDAGYALSTPRATISPDPKSLLGQWQREQSVTVALDGAHKNYNIIFTD